MRTDRLIPRTKLTLAARLAFLALLLGIISLPATQMAAAENSPLEIRWSQLSGGDGEFVPPRPEQISPLLGVVMGLLPGASTPPTPRLIRKFDGKMVKISGFPVPLRHDGFKVSEFLLVPYFGACIHVPPPPLNQIIHVIAEEPVKISHLMRSVTVTGRFETAGTPAAGTNSDWTESGYRIAVESVAY